MANEEERSVLHREFQAELEVGGDGRTIEARVVPYGVSAMVSDGREPYEEEWVKGAFEKQLGAANRVLMNVEHEQGFRGIIGHGMTLEERDDGLHGTFRVLDGADGDKALALVREEILGGISLEAVALSSKREGGVVQRIRAHLDKVALCRSPAFKQAQVLAVRTEILGIGDYPAGPTPELQERLERIGYEPLITRAITRKPWEGAASRFEDDEWRRSCVLDRGEAFETPKSRYAFPVLEPNGDLNVNGLHAAAGRMNQASASPQAKAKAARKLVRYYRQASEEPPASLLAAAGR